MSSLLVALIAGIGAGALYAMLGQGIVVSFRGSGVINFGHGAIAGYTAYSFDELRDCGGAQHRAPRAGHVAATARLAALHCARANRPYGL